MTDIQQYVFICEYDDEDGGAPKVTRVESAREDSYVSYRDHLLAMHAMRESCRIDNEMDLAARERRGQHTGWNSAIDHVLGIPTADLNRKTVNDLRKK